MSVRKDFNKCSAEMAHALTAAIKNGRLDALSRLCGQLQSVQENYMDMICLAQKYGHHDIEDWVFNQKNNLYQFQPEFFLARMANRGNLRMLQRYIDEGGDINAGNCTVLTNAVNAGQTGLALWIVENGGDAHLAPKAFIAAVQRNCDQLVRYMLAQGVSPNLNEGDALGWAARRRNLGMVDLLLNAGADPDADFCYALRHAVQGAKPEIVERILNAGVNVQTVAFQLAHMAVVNKDARTLKMICDAGVNPAHFEDKLKRIALQRYDDATYLTLEYYVEKYKYRAAVQTGDFQTLINQSSSISLSVRAAQRNCFKAYLEYMKCNGEALSFDSLLFKDKYKNSTFEILLAHNRLHEIMRLELWRGREKDALAFFDKQLHQQDYHDINDSVAIFQKQMKLRYANRYLSKKRKSIVRRK